MELAQQAFGDPRLAEALARSTRSCRACGPGEDWQGQGRFRGDNPMGMGEATRAMEELGQLDALAEQLAQSYPGARLEDIDLESLERHLGDEARVDARALAELQRELERQGLFERAPDGSLQLSPKALRRLGESALRDVVDQLGARRGERETHRSGAAGDATRRDPAVGVRRHRGAGACRAPCSTPQLRHAGGDERLLDVTDVEIVETEQRTRAAVALCVDTSWSMVQDGRWVPMKRTALALHQLISTRFRGDDLKLITFGRHAREVDLGELIGLEGVWEQGTNLHHALTLAGQHLRRNPDARRWCSSSPTASRPRTSNPTATPSSTTRPSPETLHATVAELDRLTGLRAAFTFFVLGDDPRLAAFMDGIARRCGGRVVAPTLDGLGAEVVADYLRNRR